MGDDLIVFGEDWGGHPSSTQHLVRRLAATRRVIWVNSMGMRRPRLSAYDVRRAASKLTLGLRETIAREMPSSASNPLVVNSLAVPMPGNPRHGGAMTAMHHERGSRHAGDRQEVIPPGKLVVRSVVREGMTPKRIDRGDTRG